jgi:hypothetical protein
LGSGNLGSGLVLTALTGFRDVAFNLEVTADATEGVDFAFALNLPLLELAVALLVISDFRLGADVRLDFPAALTGLASAVAFLLSRR